LRQRSRPAPHSPVYQPRVLFFTLASGGKVCDFRYKKGREVTQGWNL